MWALSYLAIGAIIGVVVTWTIANALPDGKYANQMVRVFQRDGYCFVVQSARGAAGALVRFIPQPDESAAAQWASDFRADLTKAGSTIGPDVTIPQWGFSALDDKAVHIPVTSMRPYFGVTAFATGWPCLSTRCMLISDPTGAAPPRIGILRIFRRRISLPYLPIWDGLLVNALFYGLAPFAIHSTWRAWVRRLRRSCGQCPQCTYDRHGLPPDAKRPECGTVPPARA
jgi:hypothetical protein